MISASLPPPEFKTDGMFTVVLMRAKSSGKSSVTEWSKVMIALQQKSGIRLSKSSLKIMEMVFQAPEVTIPEMANNLKITERVVEKNIQKLKENQLLERKEGHRGGYWQLVYEMEQE